MRDQLAQLLGLGPQGPQVDLNPELRAELLAELEMLAGRGDGGVPGGFPGEEGDEDDEYEDVSDEEGEGGEEQNPEAARNFLNRLMGVFGGARAPAADADEGEGEDARPQQ